MVQTFLVMMSLLLCRAEIFWSRMVVMRATHPKVRLAAVDPEQPFKLFWSGRCHR